MPDAGMAAPRGVVRNEGSSRLMWHRCDDSWWKARATQTSTKQAVRGDATYVSWEERQGGVKSKPDCRDEVPGAVFCCAGCCDISMISLIGM